MPCNNKFIADLQLDQLDYEPTTLIVGTFNPEWPASNTDEWFFGRTHNADGKRNNHFWDVLPRLYREHSMIDATATEWKQFCKEHKIAITDLISCIDDADVDNKDHSNIFSGLADNAIVFHFDDFEFVNIIQLLRNHPTIKNVYLTRGMIEAFWRHIWTPVVQYCSQNNIRERRLLTPTTSADYHHEAYNKEHPEAEITLLEDYILMRWQQEWH